MPRPALKHFAAPQKTAWRITPAAHAIALMLAINPAAAQQAFSPAWMAQKGATRSAAEATGKLPNGMPIMGAGQSQAQQQQAAAQMTQSLSNLSLAARAIAVQQAAQQAARAAAMAAGSPVPDGLVDGGLKVDTNSLTAGWVNANAPTQAAAGGKTDVTIVQTDDKAILNWESFNVGKNTTVQFDQKGGSKPDGTNTWIALNRINDPSGKPSQIAGQIKADGAVYLINRNGIVFNGASQINTRAFVASSLSLSDKQFNAGINNPQVFNGVYSDDAIAIPQFGDFTATRPDLNLGFVPGKNGQPGTLGGLVAFDPGAAPGNVEVQAGAQLSVASGGKLMLFAPKVRNAGQLSALDGQVMLAAGENIYLSTSKLAGKDGVRGLDVATSAAPGWAFAWTHLYGALGTAPVEYSAEFVKGLREQALPQMEARAAAVGYDVTNSGTVQADRGNITVQARDIHQDGVLTATTALNNRNGSILLRAWALGTHAYQNSDTNDILLDWSAGTLSMGAGSVTQVLFDATDKSEIETTALATRYQPGWISLHGKLIDFKPQAGVIAPSGTVNVQSAVNPLTIQLQYIKPDSLGDASRIYMDRDAYISVAGVQGAGVDMARNFIEAELRINELRDAPLLQDSWIRGKKVIVDRRASGVFTDGPMAGVEWVKNAAGAYTPGAWVGTPLADVAGWVGVGKTDLNELSADAGTIELRAGGAFISRAGSLLDVSGGSVRYSDGLNTSTKLMGADGKLYTMDKALSDMQYTGLAGQFVQNHERWGVRTAFGSALIGRNALENGYTEGRAAGTVKIFAGAAMVLEGGYAGGVVVGEHQQNAPSKSAGGSLEFGNGAITERPWSLGELVISHDPHQLAADFNATSKLGSDFTSAPRPGRSEGPGKLTYLLDDTLSASGMGKIDFNLLRDFTLEEGATIKLGPGAGVFINEFENSTNTVTINGTIKAAGGNVAATAAVGKLIIGAHGRLDTAGDWINQWQDGLVPGAWAVDGGAISLLAATLDIDTSAVIDVSGGGRVTTNSRRLPALKVGNAGTISLTGLTPDTDLGALDLRALAAGSAGSLLINTDRAVQLGGAASGANVLWLPGTLYGDRGFGAVTINGKGDIVIPDDVQVTQLPLFLDLQNVDYRHVSTGTSLASVAPAGRLTAYERYARRPTQLVLTTQSGAIDIGTGARVQGGIGGLVSMQTEGGAIDVDGTIDVAAGRIALAAKSLLLDEHAQLLARGTALIQQDKDGRLTGKVLDGGVVEIGSGATLLTMKPGSLIDVSGATGQVDGAGAFPGPGGQTLTLDSNGGTIRISGTGLVASTFHARAGGPGAAGGKLSINLATPASAGGTPLEQLSQALPDPDCYGFFVDGVCGGDWKQGLDFDWAPGLRSWGYEIEGTMIIPSALLGHLTTTQQIVVSTNAPQPALVGPLDGAQFGLTDTALNNFRDNLFGYELLRDALAQPGQQYALTVRPQNIAAGGFADLSLVGPTRLDGVDLALSRSIAIRGHLTGNQGRSSTLRAPQIILNTMVEGGSGAAVHDAGAGGELLLAGNLVDILREGVAGDSGMHIGGFARTVIEGNEIRFAGQLPAQIPTRANFAINLHVDGELVLRAGQVYPSTGMTGVLRAGDAITVERLGDAGQAPLSAGGTLRLEAPVIAQNGVLRAPFGSIELTATKDLTLGTGSITSVSGAGLDVPYGNLVNNEHWHDPRAPSVDAPASGSLTGLPDKRITLTAPDVNLAGGAVLDISGGGDLHAAEFVPGPGGSHDVLAMPGMYAIVPGFTGTAPFGGAAAGQRVWLAGGPGLAAGWYTLLPAKYALMPGAFAVQSNGRAWAGAAGAAIGLADGGFVVQGTQGNALSGQEDALATAWRIMPGATVRKYTDYNEAGANAFFSSDAFKLTQYRLTGTNIVTPRLARDGGAVVFDASATLVLDGTLKSQPGEGGRGGLVDIAGNKIAIVGAGQDASDLKAAGYLVIDAASLSNFGAGSLLVGGKRSGDALGLALNVTASDIVVRNDASSSLSGPEIILAASEQVVLDQGSVLQVKGATAPGSGDLIVKPQVTAIYTDPDGRLDDNNDGVIDGKDAADDVLKRQASDHGALLRMSNGDVAKVVRQHVDSSTGGLLRIGAGAIIDGGAALVLDATRTTELAGSARVAATNLAVSAGRINFGGGVEGMVFDDATLAQLSDARQLTLRSYSTFDFYRSLDLGTSGVGALTFDGATFLGHGAGAITIKGDTVTLANSGAAVTSTASTGTGTLAFDVNTLVLGAGQKNFAGYSAVTLGARDQIVGEGVGGIDTGSAALTLRTAVLTGRGGAAQSVATQGHLAVLANDTASTRAPVAQDSLGSRLSLTGHDIDFATRAQVLGGSIAMTATGGNLVVAKDAQLDVGGFEKQFFDVAEYADAGRIDLSAIGGDIRLAQGSTLNLAAHKNGGNAGALTLAASGGGTVVLDGAIAAQAGAGGKAGAFALDIAALSDFAGFSSRLNDAGFNRSRQFRIREGNVVLDGATKVEEFTLSADHGSVTVTGNIDARAAYGGTIRIIGGEGVRMQDTASLQAGASGNLGSGRVTLDAVGGTLDLAGGTIDVAGADGGVVRLRALRTAGNTDIAVDNVKANILGARSATLEGSAVYNSNSVDAVKAQAVLDANAFTSHAAQIQARLGSKIGVNAGIEIASTGDLTLGSDWNLFQDFKTSREGTLTLRAAGNLVINGNLSDGFDVAGRTGVLQDAASWNLRLVSGADLLAADRLAMLPLAGLAANQGSVIVGTANTAASTAPDNGAGKTIRTGTGDIEVRAGRDLALKHKDSVVYTAGRKDMTAWADFTTANASATYGTAGGNLDLGAQGNISAAPSGQRYTEWLNRQGSIANDGLYFGPYFDGEWGYTDGKYGPLLHATRQTSWWINYGEFRQGVGVFGGGNVKVGAGNDIIELGVSVTTTERTRGGLSAGAPKFMELRNGGTMTVDAGGALRGGQYYVARGAGVIQANEMATGRSIDVRGHDTNGAPPAITTYALAPLVAIGDASMSIRTAGDLTLQTVLDPLLVRYGDGESPDGRLRDNSAYISGYTERSSLKLASTGGDVTLVNQGEFVFRDVDLYRNSTADDNLAGKGANRYPAVTSAVAMNGSVKLQGPMTVMPGAASDLLLLAQQDVLFQNPINAGAYNEATFRTVPYTGIVMARATPAMMPSVFMPLGGPNSVNLDVLLVNAQDPSVYTGATLKNYYFNLQNPDILPLASDYTPSRIYAAQGSVLGLDMMASEQTWVQAGTDVRGIRLAARNNHAQDTTLISAGNDILSMASVRGIGAGTISVQGAGSLVLSAGRDVYANDLQIQTLGNQNFDANNRPILDTIIKGLPEQGASITVMAGMNGATGYQKFIATYLDPAGVAAMPAYLKATGADGTMLPIYLSDAIETRASGQVKVTRRGLVSYMQDMTGETLTPLDAWKRFTTLPKLAQEQFVRQVYLLELREAGRDQNEPGINGLPLNGGYNRGNAAIATLFPGDSWKGDVAANKLMLRTLSGGDINVITPGGGVQLAALGSTVPAGYGLVTLASGHIGVAARDDVIVNRSRILSFVPDTTTRGSDQIIWSTLGDIDAGRGAKTVRIPSSPEVLTDLDGITIVREKADMSGSGIGTVGDGDVDLVAPLGTVNAGDAGVRVAGNLNIAALHVLNADNIVVKGESKGIPVLAAINIGALTNASAAAAQAAAAAQDVLQRERSESRKTLPSIFSVRVLGFGSEPLSGTGNPGAAPHAEAAPNSAFQVLGQGTLTPAQLALLTPAEQRRALKEAL